MTTFNWNYEILQHYKITNIITENFTYPLLSEDRKQTSNLFSCSAVQNINTKTRQKSESRYSSVYLVHQSIVLTFMNDNTSINKRELKKTNVIRVSNRRHQRKTNHIDSSI